MLITLSAGCSSSPQSRISKNQGAYDSYPAEVRTAISKGEVQVGFNPDQVKLALGAPDRVLTRKSSSGDSEVWVYRDKSPSFGLGLGVGLGGGPVGVGAGVNTSGREFPDEKMRVVFTAGRVTAIEQTER
ncbi:hypothetical protein RAHE111665_06035 [Rariglobus hedericola]